MAKRKGLSKMTIVVEGRGKIPRTAMIAPIHDPFEVTLDVLTVILQTPGLRVKMVSPIDGHQIFIDKNNYPRMKKLYEGWVHAKNTAGASDEEGKEEIPDLKNTPASQISKDDIADAINGAFEKVIPQPKKILTPSPVKNFAEVAIIDKKVEVPKEENKE